MKKIITPFIIAMLGGVLTITSCTKPANTNPGGGGGSGLLKTMVQTTSSGGHADTTTTTLTYDNQNRVVTQIEVTKLGNSTVGVDSIIYTYGASTIQQYMSVSQATITYTLNSWGFKQSDNLGDSWTYNSNGYMVQSVQGAATTTYTYNGLNQLVTQTQVNGSITNTYTYTYASNPIGHAGSSWDVGKSTGDQFATDVEDENGTTTTLTATYVLNSQGQLGQSTIVSTAVGSSPVVTYFYYY
jgi:YD repeat-containing protein